MVELPQGDDCQAVLDLATARVAGLEATGRGDLVSVLAFIASGYYGGGVAGVLDALAERLAAGHEEHGLLDVLDPERDWRQEAAEELIDAMAYMAMAELRMRREGEQ